MNLFDSHCHLTDPAFQNELNDVLARMKQAEVAAAMIAGINADNSADGVALAEAHPHLCAAVGVHPHDAQRCSGSALRDLLDLSRNPVVKAWGEIGLDFNRMYSPRREQEKWFRYQLDLADEADLPVIFHERDSQGVFLSILEKTHHPRRRGVIHCFSGTDDELAAYLDLGYHIGITGILTMKARGSRLREQARRIPADRLLIETDAPYLTPAPERNRHRRNEPAFVRSTLIRLAAVREEPASDLAARIWRNTCRLFQFPDPQG